LQAVEAKACDVHVLGPRCNFQQLQDAHAFPEMIGADAACLPGEMNFHKPFMPEAADHGMSVNVLVYSVN